MEKNFEISVSLSYARTVQGLTCCALIRRQGKRVKADWGMEKKKKKRKQEIAAASFVQHLNNSLRHAPYATCCAVNLMKNSGFPAARHPGISWRTCGGRLQECLLLYSLRTKPPWHVLGDLFREMKLGWARLMLRDGLNFSVIDWRTLFYDMSSVVRQIHGQSLLNLFLTLLW